MTVKEYISGKLAAFHVGESQLADIVLSDINPDEEYTRDNADAVGRCMIDILVELMCAPYQKSINENGFSVSWDMDNMWRWYLWLCKKYGVTPDYALVPGLNSIIEISDIC